MVLRLADGKEALRLYWSAHAAAGSTLVSASLSAKKNIGMTHLRLATLPCEGKLMTQLLTPEEVEDHFQQSMSSLTEAHSEGSKEGSCKGRAWVESIEVHLHEAEQGLCHFDRQVLCGTTVRNHAQNRKMSAKRHHWEGPSLEKLSQ